MNSKTLSVYEEFYEFFSNVKYERVLGAFFAMLFFFPYEILGVTENFLYLISFVIFGYNLVKGVKNYAFDELENRRVQIINLFYNLIMLRKFQVRKLYNFFEYVQTQDLEANFLASLTILNTQVFYNFYLNSELSNFGLANYEFSDFDFIIFKNNIFSSLEETVIDSLDKELIQL